MPLPLTRSSSDLSKIFPEICATYGIPKLHGSLLAVDEINKAGGIMGRPIAMTHLDPQGDNARYQEFARRFLDKDQVDVLIGGETSASREAIRPIVDKHDVPYFYTNQYEGGVCDAHEFSTGAIPEQQFSTLIPYMVKTFGPKVVRHCSGLQFRPAFGRVESARSSSSRTSTARWSARNSSRSG